MNFWEFEEYKQFISVVNELLYKAFFLRFIIVVLEKELLALTWEDINFLTKQLTLIKLNLKKNYKTKNKSI